MIGKTISHYRILQKLGEGGMGVVYSAEDIKLDRTVALKLLPPELTRDVDARTRFIREAKAAAALTDSKICTIHEIDEAEGQTFIVMEYVDGQTLKEKIGSAPLRLDEVVDIAIQIAEGLQEAHKKHIVHRDIKTGNIMVTPEGQVKIMDFGLARWGGEIELTKIGTTLGTVAYMSPEQARGEVVDRRSDIWSLGIVLYEMLGGRLPFRSEYEQAVVYSILNEEPEWIVSLRPDVPVGLERVVEKAMAKDPDDRYQSVGDLLTDLRGLSEELEPIALRSRVSSERPHPSVAVLPFTNLSADPEQEYFCDGMAEEVINALTHVEGLRVVARTSAFAFKDRRGDIREIGRRLNVGTVLEGSVRKAGSRLRITAQLVSVTDGYHIWSERYDRDLGDVFAVQDEISLAIVDNLKPRLVGSEKNEILRRHTENLEAYNLYLKGRWFWSKRTEEGLKRAIECFEEAIEKDPNYALAYSGMADSWNDLPTYGISSPKDTFPKAKEAALKALELDDTLAEAHASLGLVKSENEFDWKGAEAEFRRAIELNPDYAPAHHWYSLLLTQIDRLDESIAEMKRALELDPLSLVINRNFGIVLYVAGKYDTGIELMQRTIEMDSDFIYSHLTLGALYTGKSMYKEALSEFQKERKIMKHWHVHVEAWIAGAYVRMGDRQQAEQILSEMIEKSKMMYVSPCWIGQLYVELGETDQAFKWLERAYEERDIWLRYIRVFPTYDRIRSDPRYAELLRKLALEE